MLDVVPPLLLRFFNCRLELMTSVMVLLMVCPKVLTVDCYSVFLDDEQLISTFYCDPILGWLSNLLMLERSRFKGYEDGASLDLSLTSVVIWWCSTVVVVGWFNSMRYIYSPSRSSMSWFFPDSDLSAFIAWTDDYCRTCRVISNGSVSIV